MVGRLLSVHMIFVGCSNAAGQVPQQLRQTAAKGLRQQERKPDDGDCANEIKQGIV